MGGWVGYLHSSKILLCLHRLGLWIILNVLLGVDTWVGGWVGEIMCFPPFRSDRRWVGGWSVGNSRVT